MFWMYAVYVWMCSIKTVMTIRQFCATESCANKPSVYRICVAKKTWVVLWLTVLTIAFGILFALIQLCRTLLYQYCWFACTRNAFVLLQSLSVHYVQRSIWINSRDIRVGKTNARHISSNYIIEFRIQWLSF